MPVPTPQDLDSLRWETSPHAQDRASLYLFHAQKERGWFSFLQYHPRVACPISPLMSIVLTFQALLYYVLRKFVGTRCGDGALCLSCLGDRRKIRRDKGRCGVELGPCACPARGFERVPRTSTRPQPLFTTAPC